MSDLQKLFKDRFHYREGNLYNTRTHHYKSLKGDEAGFLDKSRGRWKVKVEGKRYTRYQIVFCIFNGYIPKLIDHREGNTLNDSIGNLRDCTPAQNAWNMDKASNNTSGFKGVSLFKRTGKFAARITHLHRRIHLGYFNTAEEASKVYEEKAKELRPSFHREVVVQ